MQARYYDPVIGRFYSNDPVGFTNIHTFNRYAYANNNPYRYTDPDGRTTAPIRGSFWVGTRIGAAINYGIQAVTGASLGVLIYDAVHSESASTPTGITANPDGTVTDADGNPFEGESGGEGAGKRFKPETAEEKAANEGAECTYCGVTTTNESGNSNSRERDHKNAKSKGGNNSKNNETNSCRSCNRSKGAKDLVTWIKDKFGS